MKWPPPIAPVGNDFSGYCMGEAPVALDCTLLCLLLALILTVNAGVVEYNLTITQDLRSPDCFERLVVLVNNQLPGPEIRARPGDTLVVNVLNQMDTDVVSMHFHGLHNKGTPYSDGVPRLTQWPILPGTMYRYEMNVGDQVGTYFYHASTSIHGMTAFGPLVIDDNLGPRLFKYDEERNFLLSDFFHKDDDTITTGLLSPNFHWIFAPQSMLINGKNLVETKCTSKDDKVCTSCQHDVTTVERGKTYRFRIYGSAMAAFFRFKIAGHKLTVIEVDGSYVQPYVTDHIEVNAGQRFSVLVTADQSPGTYYIKSEPGYEWKVPPAAAGTQADGVAILQYKEAKQPDPREVPSKNALPQVPEQEFLWETDRFVKLPYPSDAVPNFPKHFNREFILTPTVVLLGDGGGLVGVPTKMVINNVTYEHPRTPLLNDLYTGQMSRSIDYSRIPPDGYDPRRGTYPIQLGEVIQVVLQLTADPNGRCDVHPFYLHGHKLFDLGGGKGAYPGKLPMLRNPPFPRDIITLAFRFIANNPGTWLFQCRATPHAIMGMAAVADYGK
ncbi:Cu-oxidase-domain-containing protein [Basidiobolus meristosporus CBS 931.73]|uniref:Cu-oxidase-domain-containing protein n=1 Tax=Basidiobolus meristosporus CBS 931.73 TaxID=1314790 RepID=A0A1Y1Y971_9FUNG|nr:Cu-oxidase-domain-containing protein [Basidiobolus meristosporus CBS 931.73]|eukprot:ORX94528.1 Cu-oxidase-domain-containing protein [Basidiobolus meristosporus CBS 931.73]